MDKDEDKDYNFHDRIHNDPIDLKKKERKSRMLDPKEFKT